MKIRKTLFYSGLAVGVLAGTFAVASTYPTQICRNGACQPVSFAPRPQLMNEVETLFPCSMKQIVFCEADPATRTCIHDGLEFCGYSSATKVLFNIPFASIVRAARGNNSFALSLDYQVQVNGYYPTCMVSESSLSLYQQGIMQLNTPYFACQMTQFGTTRVALQFQLDYIDFENRRLGAFYTVTVNGEVVGNASGYAVLRISPERRMIEDRPVLKSPWVAGQQTPMMQLQSGQMAMPDVLSGGNATLQTSEIHINQQGWGITPTNTSASGVAGWYLNSNGAYTPMAAPSTTWRGKLVNYWDKFLKFIYLDPT